MGFDNECILNIQSLPGEYFCPVCRTLICPNEALQTQCTHLYCKPCLAYIVATTQACPYDGYLVTEADSKPLMESNKLLAETIGKVTVHCQYHKSGCQWHGNLSDCITHGTTCAYGNSPVVCNRCSAQIVHRQVQEHAQLCPGLQPQAQAHHADSSMTQSSAAANQAASQDPSAVASAVSMAPITATVTTVPSTSTARAGTASAVAVSSAGATTVSTMPVAPSLPVAPTATSQGQAVAPQTLTAEQYQQQLQYQQYYQQQYPGYNPYMHQYQQYGQYQQYTQPQMQMIPQNVAQAPAQSAPYVQPQVLQPNQAQHMVPSLPQNQAHFPQLQVSAVQLQPQQHPPLQSAPQIPQMQPQNQVPLQQPPQPHAQPTTRPPVPTQVVSQPFAIPSTQATHSEVQPNIPQHHQVIAQQQNPQLQHLPQQQHPHVQQQSYPQMQAYHQPPPMPHVQPQNPSMHALTGHQSYSQPQPAHQMQQGAPLQHPPHASQQQMASAQCHTLIHPPQGQLTLQGQQPFMTAQATQRTPQQQHVGHHPQWPESHASIPPQAAPKGFPLNTSAPSQTDQSYQQGLPSSQQQMHAQPLQSQGQQFMQQYHSHTSVGRSMNYVAPPQQFQNHSGGSVKGLQASVMNQQPPIRRASDNVEATSESHGAGQPIGHGSSSLKIPASETERSEKATDATRNTEVNDRKDGGEPAVVNPIALDRSDGSGKGKGKIDFAAWEGNSHDPDVMHDRGAKTDISNDLDKVGSLHQTSQQHVAALVSHAPPAMGPQHPYGPDSMLPQHMRQPGHISYLQELPNQMRPPKHSFPENIRPPMQQPYASYHSEMAPRVPGPNPNLMHIPQPSTIRPDGGMIRPPMGGPLPGQHDTIVPPFAPEGTTKSNGVGDGSHEVSRALFEGGFNFSQQHSRPFAGYPGTNNVNRKDFEDNMKKFSGPTHLDGEGLQRAPKTFEGGLGRPDGFSDSLPGRPPLPNQPGPFPIGFGDDYSRKPNSTVGYPDFISPGVELGHHGIDGMHTLRNPGPFLQGMTGGAGGLHKDQLGSGNLPGKGQLDFDNPEFPHTRFHPGDTFVPRNLHGAWGGGVTHGHGQMHGIEPSGFGYRDHLHPDDPNLGIDYSRHGFPKESSHFGSVGY
ncbi:hypothetical protein GUJ93_ZPchr0012g18836 [Zizania palustris]|uniref:RING-type domain-containing protein n=1 Tax=Zizania palustris TaxID=103762 RepID=A0A8J6BUV5_ZIZPA|nr:hypothetical protein GUJ93_ZPchr0012g18836 [Zizania palustris]